MFKLRLCLVIALAFAVLVAAMGTEAYAAASIQNITPSQGPITGGTQVTLAGSGFTGTTLTLDGTAVTPSSASDTQIVFQTPVHNNGIVTIKLSGNGPNAYAEFLYVPPRLQDLPPGYITTVAGIGLFTGLYRRATQAEIRPQGSPAFDRQGNLYIPEPNNNRVIRVRPDGILEPFAGSGIPDYLSTSGIGDGGSATEASLTFPRGVTTDATGNVYITEYKHRIRRVDAHTGIITTIAGDGTAGFSGDGGPAVQARLKDASHITGDGNGTLYFIDFDDASNVARIRKITPEGIISTVAGIGPEGFSGDGGPATQAQFNLIMGDNGSLALDPQGNLFIVDTGNRRIRRIDGRTGTITTVFGPASVSSVACDSTGNIYFDNNLRIVKMSPSGQILVAYGTGQGGLSEDGTPVTDARGLGQPGAVDALGNIIFLENMQRVRRINVATGKLETVAGMMSPAIGENGPALATTLQIANSGDLAFLSSGELLVGDAYHSLIRKIDANGAISTFGQGGYPNFPEGKGWGSITAPVGVETDPSGQVFVADTRKVYRIDVTRQVHMIAGTDIGEQYGYSGDGGPATEALLCQPWDIARDNAGNLFIADTNNNRIRRVDARTGIITTVAGSGPVNGFEHYGSDGHGSFSGDGGPATQATLNTPYGVAVDSQGNLFIADGGNRRIRKVDTNGIITTFAANTGVNKLTFDGAGNLYSVFDTGLVRYDSTGRSRQVAGQWPPGFSGDGGPALQAKTRTATQAMGVAIDAEGNVFFADSGNLRIRAVRYGAVMAEPGSNVTASSGSAQMTPTGTTFPTALQVTLKSPDGTPANGIRVDFSAPASGASCTFPGGSSTYSTLTNIYGQARVTCTANSQLGTYNVTATPLVLGASASFSLTNTMQGCTYSISPSSQAFNTSSNTGTVTVTTSASTCVWTAMSNDSWITITSSASGTGNGTISYSITASSNNARMGTITIAGLTHTVNQASWIYSNSIGSRNTIKVTDMSGSLSTSGATITVSAWDISGNALAESSSATSLKLYRNGTTTITGPELSARFTGGTPILYALSADSSKYIITNVKISSDGTLNVPNENTSGTTKFVANSVGRRNSIKITDMSGSLSTPASITVAAWDESGNSISEVTGATPLTLANHGTTTIAGTDLMARFMSIPMSYEFTVGSSKYVITNVKSSTDGSINIPYSYTSGTTNFVANSIGSRNTMKISDVSGAPFTPATITISAWDPNGNAIPESTNAAAPLTLSSRGTTSITGTNLAARFSGTPMAYEFTVNSSKYIITNVKGSTDGTINIPAIYTNGTTMYASNDISSRSNIKITDASGLLSSSGASITVAAWDANGISIPESGSATSLTLLNYGTTSITGDELIARFPTGAPALYEFTVNSSKYIITNVKRSTDSTVTIPSVYTSGVAGGI